MSVRLSRFLLSLLLLFSLLTGACSTRVRVGPDGPYLFAKPVDLSATRTSWSRIRHGEASARDFVAYNENVRSAVVQTIHRLPKGECSLTIRTGAGQTSPLEFDPGKVRSFHAVDRLMPAHEVRVQDGVLDRARVDGIGLPLLARLRKGDHDPLISDTGLWIPVTAYLCPDGETPTLKLIETTRGPCETIHGFPFTANFSAALAQDIIDRRGEFQEFRALINYEKFESHMGMQRATAFDPEKTPVILIHGIFSSPLTWTHTLNMLLAERDLRNRFEFWTFAFPTGAPLPYLSQRLRESVCEMRDYRSAHGACPNHRMIIIGHSMGGLMAKTLTQSCGDRQWREFFGVAPDELAVSPEERILLEKMFYFEPLPCVERVIFTATPHRGTVTADKFPAQLANSLMTAPRRIASVSQRTTMFGGDFATPLGVEIARDFPTSIEHMQKDSALGRIFAELPLNPCVKYHTIIGSKKGLDVPRAEMTDGVVELVSASIPGVESERIVDSDHGVHLSPGGIEEIIRILRLSH